MNARAFAAEVEALTRTLDADRTSAVMGLRAVEEEWARSVLALPESPRPHGAWAFEPKLVAQVRQRVEQGLAPEPAQEAAAHLAAAEGWQWEIGTWSSGSGEGLSSMFEVRSLQLARAWLLALLSRQSPALADEARRLAAEVAGDPNRIASSHQKHVDALRRFLRAGAPGA